MPALPTMAIWRATPSLVSNPWRVISHARCAALPFSVQAIEAARLLVDELELHGKITPEQVGAQHARSSRSAAQAEGCFGVVVWHRAVPSAGRAVFNHPWMQCSS